MNWFTDLVKIAVPIVVDFFAPEEQTAATQDGTQDGMPKLVPRPTPFTPREIPSFGKWKSGQTDKGAFPNFSARGGTIQNVVPALKSVNPSTVESQYWRAIFDPRKTRIT